MLRLTPLPPLMQPYHPVAFLSTWFGSGLLRPAPGTWGTAAAYPILLPIGYFFGQDSLFITAALIFLIGIFVSDRYCRTAQKDDAPEIVIDEVAAISLVLAALPFTITGWIAGFLLFRLFDILKPWPISAIERRVGGGFGVMIDDVIAALFAVAVWSVGHMIWASLA